MTYLKPVKQAVLLVKYLLFNNLIMILGISLIALAVCSEAYFSAVAKMGDQALHTLSSRSLGKCVSIPESIPELTVNGKGLCQDSSSR